MLRKVQYIDQTDRQAILDTNVNMILVGEENITEGNFLIFTDIKPIENQLQDLNNTANMILLKQEGII
ncbi:MAG: hypothetical protein PHG64_14370 [Paludibacter sp.]|nr:hypothetical protein [Paludibacter sp.]